MTDNSYINQRNQGNEMNAYKINDRVIVDRGNNFWFPGKHKGVVVGVTAKRVKVKIENGNVSSYHPKNIESA